MARWHRIREGVLVPAERSAGDPNGSVPAGGVHDPGQQEIRIHEELGLGKIPRHGLETLWKGRKVCRGMRKLSPAGA